MTKDPTDALTLEIMRHLEVDWQWVRHFDAEDTASIAEARSAGRRAGHALNLKVLTFQSAPEKREDRKVVVIVAVNQKMDADDDERMTERSRLLIDMALGGGRLDPR